MNAKTKAGWCCYIIPTALAWLGCMALWWSAPFGRDPTPELPVVTASLRCAPELGYRATYRVRVDLHSQFDPSRSLGLPTAGARPESSALWLVGALHAQAIERRRSGMLLQLGFHPLESSPGAGEQGSAEAQSMKQPFFALLGEDCQLREFGFEADSAPEAVNRLQGVLQGLSMSLAGHANRQSWSSQEWDSLGLYVAEYRRADAPRTFTKRRRAYLKARPDANGDGPEALVRVLGSQARATLDADRAWLERLESKEQLRLSASDQFSADLTWRISLEKVEVDDDAFPPKHSVDAMVWRTDNSPALVSQARQPEPPSELQQMPLALALARFAALLGAGDDGAAIAEYARYLRARPDAAHELMSLIARRAVPAELEAALFHALEIADTPEAHAALLGGLGEAHVPMNRVRAASALSDIPRPDMDTLDGLRQAAREARASDRDAATRVRNAATLAMGVLEARARSSNPELAKLTQQSIRDALAQSTTDEQRGVVLAAIGNSGNVAFISDVEPFLRSQDASLRSNAVGALRKMPVEATQGMFAELIAREPLPSLRSDIARTFAAQARASRGVAAPAVLDSAIAQLKVEQDLRVRAELIELIGPACAGSETAMQALAEQFAQETDASMLTLIGRYVPAGRLGA